MHAASVLGYAFDGDIYCVKCAKKVQRQLVRDKACLCSREERDRNGICTNNCHGYGPTVAFADDVDDGEVCGDCGDELWET